MRWGLTTELEGLSPPAPLTLTTVQKMKPKLHEVHVYCRMSLDSASAIVETSVRATVEPIKRLSHYVKHRNDPSKEDVQFRLESLEMPGMFTVRACWFDRLACKIVPEINDLGNVLSGTLSLLFRYLTLSSRAMPFMKYTASLKSLDTLQRCVY